MKVLVAIALLSVVSALPRQPDDALIDFRPLIVPKEVIEAMNNEGKVNQDEGTAVKFVDSAINDEVNGDDSVAVKFVETSEVAEDLSAVQFVNNNEENVGDFAEQKEAFVPDVDVAIDENDGSAVNFVDSPIDENDGSAVNFVDTPVDENDNSVDAGFDGTASVNELPVIDGIAINFVDAPIIAEVAEIILIGDIFEPISASELESVRVINNVPYPPKIYDNPLLR